MFKLRSSVLSAVCVSAGLGSAALADMDFTQTVDDWWYNKYEWDAQTQPIQRPRGGDALGTVKTVWIRVVQRNGSLVGTDVFCTTMTKTFAGAFGDRWDVDVPAGSLEDTDFWDCSSIGIEVVECAGGGRVHYNTVPGSFGELRATDYVSGNTDDDPLDRRVSIDPFAWDDALVRSAGFDFAVYAYQVGPGVPTVINHVDELGLTTFSYQRDDAFGSGAPFDPARLRILGIKLDPSWGMMSSISNGLHAFQWMLVPGGGQLFTDQGVFQILNAQPIVAGWTVFCTADLNQDHMRDFLDVIEFLTLLTVADPQADWNGDGSNDFFDIVAFLNDFSLPCP